MYQNGNGVQKDAVEAAKWFRKAAENGEKKAMRNLGTMYQNGDGVQKDAAEAAKWIRKAAEHGEENAMCILGTMYQKGEGVSRDDSEAFIWYRKAAELRNAEAMEHLGQIYQYGLCGVATDCVEAVRWYCKAADHGNAEAMYELGYCYKVGRGVPLNFAEAIKWFSKAADLGNAVAMFFLGTMYQNGEGVPVNAVEASGWYRNAAEYGDAMGMCHLGLCYSRGSGVPKDDVSAYIWYSLAASTDPNSVAYYQTDWSRVRQRMTEAQIAEARKMATSYSARLQIRTATIPEGTVSKTEQLILTLTGTGFFVTTDGYLLTAWHIVSKTKAVRVSMKGKAYEAKVIRSDKANDMVLLKVDGTFPALAFSPSEGVKLGEDVFTVGFPNIGLQGIAPKLTRGNVGALSGIQDDPSAFQISVPVQPGNSGGPLLDIAGNVVGVGGDNYTYPSTTTTLTH